jgi:hypothetical protein
MDVYSNFTIAAFRRPSVVDSVNRRNVFIGPLLSTGHIHHIRLSLKKCVFAKLKTKTKLRGLSPQANYSDRATVAVGEVVPTFAGRGCYVVSATDSHGR